MNLSTALKSPGASASPIDLLRSPFAPLYSRANPYLAPLTAHERLTRPGSRKDVRHLVVELKGSGLTYLPGDSLGALGCNPPPVVAELIEVLGFDPETPVSGPKGTPHALREALVSEYVINRANRKFVAALAARCSQGEQRNRLMEIADNNDLLCAYVETRDYVDILKEFSHARFDTAAEFVAYLTPVTPRLYSIASSPLAHPGEAHLCVAVVRYDTHGRPKKGLASGFLADHADMFVKNIPVYIQPARSFRLPQDGSRDIIMIGPGTGVAPFRAFLEHRAAQGATGRNWLFFGEQHRATDFLYEEELLTFQKQGLLHRLDLAFSRDQHERIYVQHRVQEQAHELWTWLHNGAYLYVCGDAKHMARDVHQAFCDVAREQGGLSPEAATEYVSVTLMKTEKRYLRDVY
jgi:sulfite reductase (NADPH) flavoprotein alpha-component